jgi:hypothetical protein
MFGDASAETAGIDPENIVKAAKLVLAAENLIQNFPKAWEHMNKLAAEDFKKKRRMSMQRYLEDTRHFEWTGFNGEDFRASNSVCPALSRLMIENHPEYKECFELRPSMVDFIFNLRSFDRE